MINGQFGVVFDFRYIGFSIAKVYVKLDDEDAGKETMPKDLNATKHWVIQIQIIDSNITVSKNSSQTFKKT